MQDQLCSKSARGAEQIYSRAVSMPFGGDAQPYTLIFDPDLPMDAPWTIAIQETGSGQGELRIRYRRNLVTLDQFINIGKYGGDIITGVGSFQLAAKPSTTDTFSVEAFWTLQPKLIDVGVKQTARQMVTSGEATQTDLGDHDGFVPFPFNTVSIFSNADTYRFGIKNYNGTIFIQSMITITQPSSVPLEILVPPMGRVVVDQNTGSNKEFTAVYSRK